MKRAPGGDLSTVSFFQWEDYDRKISHLMALPELQQAASLIKRAGRVLLLVPEKPSTDAFASMLAFYLALQGQSEFTLDAVSPSHVPRLLQFLPGSSQIQMRPQLKPDVVVDIAGPAAVSEVHQESLQGGVRVHITFPEGTQITKDQLETLVRALPYDVVIIFGAADLEELGTMFSNHTDFFYNTPIINIDHRAGNEHFGTVNIVDITAASIAEVTHDLISSLPETTLTPDIATALYAGIVAATDSFQKPSTTPNSFQLAARLMEYKADRSVVIQHLVKTKPLPLLKLLGRLYARLRYEEGGQLFWSILRPLDFTESGATPIDIPDTMRELTNNIAGFNAAFVLYEHNGQYDMYLLLGKGLAKRRQEIQATLGAQKSNGALRLNFVSPSLEDAERQALQKIREILP